MNKILEAVRNPGFRKWIYGISLAVLVFLGGEGIISAAQQENIGSIVQAVLQTAPAAGFALAIRKTKPVVTDVKPDIDVDQDGAAIAPTDDVVGDWDDWDEEKETESLVTTDLDVEPDVELEDPTDPTVRARHGVL